MFYVTLLFRPFYFISLVSCAKKHSDIFWIRSDLPWKNIHGDLMKNNWISFMIVLLAAFLIRMVSFYILLWYIGAYQKHQHSMPSSIIGKNECVPHPVNPLHGLINIVIHFSNIQFNIGCTKYYSFLHWTHNYIML